MEKTLLCGNKIETVEMEVQEHLLLSKNVLFDSSKRWFIVSLKNSPL